jgi:DNA-binding transcriptional LysR family regulator
LELETVIRYRHVAVSPAPRRGGGTAPRGAIRPAELVTLPLVLLQRGTQTRRLIDEALGGLGLVPERVLDVGTVSLQKELVRAGLGVGVLPDYAVEPRDRLAARPIAGAPVREIAVAWRRELPPTAALSAFLAAVRRPPPRRTPVPGS